MLDGFPLALRSLGYRTAFFHGGDLSFEQQRLYLTMVGFEELHELEPGSGVPVIGWGYPDHYVFEQLRGWVQEHVAGRAGAPYFAAFTTLSVHHPFDLPEGWTRRFDSDDPEARFYDALAYTDHYLGRFYDWYLEHEAPRGTLIHDYTCDDQGLVTDVNLIVGSTHNQAPINLSVKQAATSMIHGGVYDQGMLNKIEMAIRAYDP